LLEILAGLRLPPDQPGAGFGLSRLLGPQNPPPPDAGGMDVRLPLR
jgi:hypothetical protein